MTVAPDYASRSVLSRVSFKYAPSRRRIYKSSSSATSIFSYDGDNLVEETNASGTAVARYSHGLSIDEPLAMLRGGGATSFYHADGLGSVTSLSNSSNGRPRGLRCAAGAVASVVQPIRRAIQRRRAALVQHTQKPREIVVRVDRAQPVWPGHLRPPRERIIAEAEIAT